MASPKIRERNWRKQGIREPSNAGIYLTWRTYQALMEFQKNRCAICDKIFFLDKKRGDSCDHDHKTGLARGILCSRKVGCNWRLGTVERYKIKMVEPGSFVEAALKYLKDPPAQQWLRLKEEKLGIEHEVKPH